jgi:hypothetical protein
MSRCVLLSGFGPDPPAAVFFYSPDRGGEHPEQHLAGYAGLMQADAYERFIVRPFFRFRAGGSSYRMDNQCSFSVDVRLRAAPLCALLPNSAHHWNQPLRAFDCLCCWQDALEHQVLC